MEGNGRKRGGGLEEEGSLHKTEVINSILH